MKLLYMGVNGLGLSIDAYYLMCGISILFSGLTIILLYDLLLEYFNIGKRISWFVSLAVVVSYEYWRYSYEAEVYIISLFFILWAFKWFIVTEKQQGYKHVIPISVLCAFSTLLYKPNFIPLFMVFPLLYLFRGKIRQLVLFYGFGALMIIGSFAIVYVMSDQQKSFLEYLFGGVNQPVGSAYTSLFIIASNTASVLWLFASDGVVQFIQRHFPHKVMEEEVFLARQIKDYTWLLWLNLGLLGITSITTLIIAWRRGLSLNEDQKRLMGILLVWIVVYASFLMLMDPSSNEPWLMIEIPLVILFAIVLVKPISKKNLWLPYLGLLLLFVNNLLGGMWLLKDPAYDYIQQKSDWLIKNTDRQDVILSYGSIGLIRYLTYKTHATVIDIENDTEHALEQLKTMEEVKGNVYLTRDVMEPVKAIKFRSGEIMTQFDQAYKQNGLKATPVVSGEFAVYKINKKAD